MTQDHPITPPPELLRQWCLHSSEHETYEQFWRHIATQAAQWGADQELEACCEHMRDHQWGFVERPDGTMIHRAVYLQQSRRPKPPTLKEQALEALEHILHNSSTELGAETIRRALEALDD